MSDSKKGSKNNSKKRKWAGTISQETGDEMLAYLEKSRNEWERINPINKINSIN